MPARDPRRNRGPAAAAGNRAALLAAGREQFAAHGYDVPLSAVARAAGVSQGVLYRHFPSRVALALAVFSDNMDELEEGAARLGDDPDGSHLAVVVGRLLTMTLASAAFVDLAIHASEQPDIDAIPRLRALVDAPLERARRHGRVRPDLTSDDVLLLVRMAYGIVMTGATRGDAERAVRRAVHLMDPLLGAHLPPLGQGLC